MGAFLLSLLLAFVNATPLPKPVASATSPETRTVPAVAVVPAASTPAPPHADNRPAFAIALAGVLALLGGLGMKSMGRVTGVLITERNVMSLSRFQTALWTCLLLSGLVTIVFAQIKSGDLSLDLQVAPELWALMGISTASLVGTPLILSGKTGASSGPAAPGGQQGVIYANSSPSQAAFGDLVEGDELGNANSVDLSKVQMFAFTIVSLAIYLAALLSELKDLPAKAVLPAPSTGLLALLGISHAGYLTYKSVSHTGTSTGQTGS